MAGPSGCDGWNAVPVGIFQAVKAGQAASAKKNADLRMKIGAVFR
jgi:hypothetical protein